MGSPQIARALNSNPVSGGQWHHSSHHPREVLSAQFSLYVHKGGLNQFTPFIHSLEGSDKNTDHWCDLLAAAAKSSETDPVIVYITVHRIYIAYTYMYIYCM